MGARNKLLLSAVAAIGDTPLVELSRVVAGAGLRGRVLAKLEHLSPGSSKKDRIARQIVEDAVAAGDLTPGQPVVELTSGNTGTGLAITCAVLGHPFVAVMSRGNSEERAAMMRALGAEVVLVDQLEGSKPGQVSGGDLALVEEAAQRIVAKRGAFRADQFELEGSFSAHFEHTGPEAWEQSGGAITAFVDFVGSGGTFCGVAAYLKQRNPECQCHIVEPSGCAVLSGDGVTSAAHRIQGGGYSMASLPLLERLGRHELIDGFIKVSSEDAEAGARQLAREEGIFAGFSSGANLHAALEVLRRENDAGNDDATCLMMVCDSGLKVSHNLLRRLAFTTLNNYCAYYILQYLSTSLWSGDE